MFFIKKSNQKIGLLHKFIIDKIYYKKGGNKMIMEIQGNQNLTGVVNIGGCKNSAVAIIPASILCDEEVRLINVPQIDDCFTLLEILKSMGHGVTIEDNEIIIKPCKKIKYNIKSDLVVKLRGSYYFLGSMLSKNKKVKTYYPGGCDLGSRPINYHLDGFKKMNVTIKTKKNMLILKTKKLIGEEINLEFPSVGATINIMLAATKAEGTTIINNCALEPEVEDVAKFLISMGANITGLGTKRLVINGVKKLFKTTFTLMPDRIEAGTYLILGAAANGRALTVNNVDTHHLKSLTNLLRSIGCTILEKDNSVTISKSKPLKNFAISVSPYPGFPTDLQQPLTTLMTQIEGASEVTETIFSNRFSQVEELLKMGADIKVVGNTVKVMGKTVLMPGKLKAKDLRGSAALVIAACLSEGVTTIENMEVFFRGYEYPIKKLAALGIKCKIISR